MFFIIYAPWGIPLGPQQGSQDRARAHKLIVNAETKSKKYCQRSYKTKPCKRPWTFSRVQHSQPDILHVTPPAQTDPRVWKRVPVSVLLFCKGNINNVSPLIRYKELMTGKTARKIIAILWILSFVIGLIPFFGWNLKNSSLENCSSVNSTNCKACYFESVVDMQYMVYFNFFVCVLVPLIIMLGIYAKIFTVARKQLRQIELKCVGNGDNQNKGLLQKEIRAAKSLSIIVGLFTICWLPVHILNCLTLFYGDLEKPPVVMYVAIILSHANSAINPIIYAYRIQDFRNTFRKILVRHFLCRKEELYLSSNGSRRKRDQRGLLRALGPAQHRGHLLIRDTLLLRHSHCLTQVDGQDVFALGGKKKERKRQIHSSDVSDVLVGSLRGLLQLSVSHTDFSCILQGEKSAAQSEKEPSLFVSRYLGRDRRGDTNQ
ncbi:hypothetical protein CCH79_00002157 [Gambusia affinis]|uniref:G-protein coupled receptors family 1 profile domain-containing protein n=1 Tax=Gambusia affinis TaxID=33528 RepID=A0A315VJ93_GAMAF|nr:hypothetical protein CCH79_00002157 [Gambusia affinis]